MTNIMLYIELMNSTIGLHVSVQMTIRFVASAIFLVASAAMNLDLASSALLPNEAGVPWFAQRSALVNTGAAEFIAVLNAIPQPSEAEKDTVRSRPSAAAHRDSSAGFEKEVDLRILNRGKDYFIEPLQSEREAMLEKLVSGSHRIGELEGRLRQLAAPRDGEEHSIERSGRSFGAR